MQGQLRVHRLENDAAGGALSRLEGGDKRALERARVTANGQLQRTDSRLSLLAECGREQCKSALERCFGSRRAALMRDVTPGDRTAGKDGGCKRRLDGSASW